MKPSGRTCLSGSPETFILLRDVQSQQSHTHTGSTECSSFRRRMSWPVSMQPQATPAFSEETDWSSGICDCCDDMKQCCFAFWCCPCFACITTKEFGQCLCLPLLEVFGCGCVQPITMSMRASVRQRYGIRGSLCRDCVCSTCCLPCVWCQMSTEMKKGKIPTMLSDIIGRR